MLSNDALARGNESYSSVCLSELARDLTCKFEHELVDLVQKTVLDTMTPVRLRSLLGGGQELLAAAGRGVPNEITPLVLRA